MLRLKTIVALLVCALFVGWVHCPKLHNKCPVLVLKQFIDR